jgi:hypothetical protein
VQKIACTAALPSVAAAAAASDADIADNATGVVVIRLITATLHKHAAYVLARSRVVNDSAALKRVRTVPRGER